MGTPVSEIQGVEVASFERLANVFLVELPQSRSCSLGICGSIYLVIIRGVRVLVGCFLKIRGDLGDISNICYSLCSFWHFLEEIRNNPIYQFLSVLQKQIIFRFLVNYFAVNTLMFDEKIYFFKNMFIHLCTLWYKFEMILICYLFLQNNWYLTIKMVLNKKLTLLLN